MNNELTLSKGKELVKDEEESITQLINPEDLTYQDIDNWDNVDIDRLKDELGMGMGDSWTYPINHPYSSIIKEIAINQFVDDMQRIPMGDLNPERFKGIEDMAVKGYWPNSYSRQEIKEVVYEWKDDIEFFHEYEDNVRMEIESAILEARIEDLE